MPVLAGAAALVLATVVTFQVWSFVHKLDRIGYGKMTNNAAVEPAKSEAAPTAPAPAAPVENKQPAQAAAAPAPAQPASADTTNHDNDSAMLQTPESTSGGAAPSLSSVNLVQPVQPNSSASSTLR